MKKKENDGRIKFYNHCKRLGVSEGLRHLDVVMRKCCAGGVFGRNGIYKHINDNKINCILI